VVDPFVTRDYKKTTKAAWNNLERNASWSAEYDSNLDRILRQSEGLNGASALGLTLPSDISVSLCQSKRFITNIEASHLFR
jgi:hypothetical protein